MQPDTRPVPWVPEPRYLGRTSGVQNYSVEDKTALLKCVTEVLPRGQDQWRRVASDYNAYALSHGRQRREWDHLKQRFSNWANARKPTGATMVPFEVTRARELQRAIEDDATMTRTPDEARAPASPQTASSSQSVASSSQSAASSSLTAASSSLTASSSITVQDQRQCVVRLDQSAPKARLATGVDVSPMRRVRLKARGEQAEQLLKELDGDRHRDEEGGIVAGLPNLAPRALCRRHQILARQLAFDLATPFNATKASSLGSDNELHRIKNVPAHVCGTDFDRTADRSNFKSLRERAGKVSSPRHPGLSVTGSHPPLIAMASMPTARENDLLFAVPKKGRLYERCIKVTHIYCFRNIFVLPWKSFRCLMSPASSLSA